MEIRVPGIAINFTLYKYIAFFLHLSRNIMQLNAIGLLGVLFLINLIQSVGFDFVTATCLVLLSDNETSRTALVPPLVRKNPLVSFNDK